MTSDWLAAVLSVHQMPGLKIFVNMCPCGNFFVTQAPGSKWWMYTITLPSSVAGKVVVGSCENQITMCLQRCNVLTSFIPPFIWRLAPDNKHHKIIMNSTLNAARGLCNFPSKHKLIKLYAIHESFDNMMLKNASTAATNFVKNGKKSYGLSDIVEYNWTGIWCKQKATLVQDFWRRTPGMYKMYCIENKDINITQI